MAAMAHSLYRVINYHGDPETRMASHGNASPFRASRGMYVSHGVNARGA